MNTPLDGEASVVIGRWTNFYRVPADHPAPEEVRARLDGFVSSEVLDACRRWLQPMLDQADPSIWLIREIDLDLAIDASPSAQSRAAVAWGEQLATEIRRAIDQGPNGDSVLLFPNRAAYIAQWVRDLASSRAWDKWYYAEFNSLRSLSTSAAIAESIIREPAQSRSILFRLAFSNGLEQVLGALHEADASRVFQSLQSPAQLVSGENIWIARLLAHWNGVALGPLDSHFCNALRLFAAAAGEWPHSETGASLLLAIDGLLSLRRILAALTTGDAAQRFLHAAIRGQHTAAQQIAIQLGIDAPISVIEFARQASGGDQGWAALATSILAPADPSSRMESEAFLTELGGIFLLGPSFIDLDIHGAIRAAAGICADPLRAESVLRHLLAVRCIGQARAASSINDPAIRAFSGLDAKPSLKEFAEVLADSNVGAAIQVFNDSLREESEDDSSNDDLAYFAIATVFPELTLDPAREQAWSRIAQAILRRFALRLLGFARSTPEYLFTNFLAGTSSVRLIPSRFDVRLPHSPLSLVLHIAGAYRTYVLPWQEGVEIWLHQPTD